MRYALVVDDELPHRKLIRSYLEKLGYTVIEAVNGQEAVAYFPTEKFNLITMDYNMPEKNGVEAIKEIRQMDKTIPIIGISAAATTMRQALRQEEKITVLSKPLDVRELGVLIEQLE